MKFGLGHLKIVEISKSMNTLYRLKCLYAKKKYLIKIFLATFQNSVHEKTDQADQGYK